MSPDKIEPFDPITNLLRTVEENERALIAYVNEHQLMTMGERLWRLRSFEDRLPLLGHLWDQIRDSGKASIKKPARFLSVIPLLTIYTNGNSFISAMAAKDWSDPRMVNLRRYIALYVEPQGRPRPYFSSRAFLEHYLDAHSLPPPP